MATEQPLFKLSEIANADLSAAQYLFVKFNADRKVILCAAVTDVPVGVLQNKPASQVTAEIAVVGLTKVTAGGTLAAGDLIGTDGAGKAVKYVPGTDTTKYIVGMAIEAAAANDVTQVILNCANPHRAA